MSASPEVAKQNGKKSSGPITERGKAISAKNSIKHGMLAQQPPLLVIEDLETFQGLIQGLIKEYQPQHPTEYLLVQQAAMGWLRLYRLWGVEAAIANKEVLQSQREAKYPDFLTEDPLDSILSKDKPKTYSDILKGEKDVLLRLISNFNQDLDDLPSSDSDDEGDWLEAVSESSGVAHYYHDRNAEVWQEQSRFDDWINPDEGEDDSTVTVTEVISRIRKLQRLARQRLKVIEPILVDIDCYNQAIQRAEAASKGLQNPELFSRYERHINHALEKALDRLAAIKEQRNNQDSIGSFGQIDILETLKEVARERQQQANLTDGSD